MLVIIFLVVAVVLLLLAAANVVISPRVSLGWLGLAFLAASLLWPLLAK
jgi:hypothetical protein